MTYLQYLYLESVTMPKIITANMLATGAVVFLGPAGDWVRKVDEARLFPDSAAAGEGLAIGLRDAGSALVVDPFITDRDPAAATEGMTLRDRIRAHGPTIRYLPSGA